VFVTSQHPHPAVPNLREAEAAGITPDRDEDQQLLGRSGGGDSLPDVLLPDVPLTKVSPDGWVCEE